MQRLNQSRKYLKDRCNYYYYKNFRLLTTSQNEIIEKREKIFIDELNNFNTKSVSNKDDSLESLNKFFNLLRNYISREFVRDKYLNNNWRSAFAKHEQDKIYEKIKLINNHDSYKSINEFILNNFSSYNQKEIAFITKTFTSINSSVFSELIFKLKDYCEANVSKFDLFDLENIAYNERVYEEFIKKSAGYAIHRIYEANDSERGLNINFDNSNEFENQMQKRDLESLKIWLRLNNLNSYKEYLDFKEFRSVIYNLFEKSLILTERDAKLYETNCIINLCALSSNLKTLDYTRKIKPFFEKNFTNNLIQKLDLYHYKNDLYDYLIFLIYNNKDSLLNDHLYDYFKNCTENANCSHLFFEYSRILNKLLQQRSTSNQVTSLSLNNNNERIYSACDYNQRYYSYIENRLDKKFCSILQSNYDLFIQDFNGLCIKGISGSFMLINLIHKAKENVLDNFYSNFYEFYKNIKPADLIIYREDVLKLLETLVDVNLNNNKKTNLDESNFIKFSSLFDADLYFKENTSFSKTHLTSFLLLNENMCKNNFKIIHKKVIENKFFHHQNVQFLVLLKKNFHIIRENFKGELVEILEFIFEKSVKKLLILKSIIKMSVHENLLNDTTINLLKNVNWEFDYFTVNDRRRIFTYANEINFKLDDEHLQEFVFKTYNLNVRIDQKLALFSELFIQANHYQENVLDELWNFIIKTLECFNGASLNLKEAIPKIICLIRIMRVFSHYNYTTNPNYERDKKHFKMLNNQLYNEILRNKISIKNLLIYVQNLVSLNIFVDNALNDLIQLDDQVKKYIN